MDQYFSSGKGERWTERGNIFEVEKADLDTGVVLFEGEVAVKNESKVPGVCGGVQRGIVQGEAEVVGGFGEGCW